MSVPPPHFRQLARQLKLDGGDNPRLSGGPKSGLYRVGRTVGSARAWQA
jgi:hypothetical protein